MEVVRWFDKHYWLLATGLVAPWALTLVLRPFRASFPDTTVTLLLVLVVVAVSSAGDRLAGLLAALSAGLSFVFFVAQPFRTFAINSPVDIQTALILLGVGGAVSEIAHRLSKAIQANQRLAAIIEYSDDAIVSRGLNDIVTSWNPAAERMYGFPSDEVMGTSARSIIPKDKTTELKTTLAMLKVGEHVAHFETVRVRKDGTAFPVSITASPIRDEKGVVVGHSMIIRDLTEQQHATQYARSLIEASLDPLMTISPGGEIDDVNEATVKATGVPRDELLGTGFSGYFTDPDKASEGYQRVFLQGSVTDYPLTLLHRDGTQTDVLYNASVYRDLSGKVLGVLAAARDVTKLMQAQRQLQAANEAIQGFTAVAAHDLRSPLASILGFSTLLTNGWDTFSEEDRRKFVATIDRQSQNMSGLLDDLFTSATIDAGGIVTSPEPIVLREAIDRTLERGDPDAGTVAVSCSADLVVRVDPHHLERILDNYMQNAFKYGEPPVRIEATRVGDMVQVQVLDQGPGVPPEFASRLFGKFARADTAATRAKKGTGLGLSIVRGLAEAGGGQAHYEPNIPHGSCFVVRLPAGDGPGA